MNKWKTVLGQEGEYFFNLVGSPTNTEQFTDTIYRYYQGNQSENFPSLDYDKLADTTEKNFFSPKSEFRSNLTSVFKLNGIEFQAFRKVSFIRNSPSQSNYSEYVNEAQLKMLNDSFSFVLTEDRKFSTMRKESESDRNVSKEGSIQFKDEDSFMLREEYNKVII